LTRSIIEYRSTTPGFGRRYFPPKYVIKTLWDHKGNGISCGHVDVREDPSIKIGVIIFIAPK
jgi:hypothetical protein